MIRCFAEPSAWTGVEVRLDAAESGHLVRVLRAGAGDPVEVFDGQGRRAAAVVRSADRRAAVLAAGTATLDPPPLPVVLIQALPKGGKGDLIVQKAVELGAARIDWVAAERSVVRLSRAEADRRLARWRRIAINAAKQCGRNRVPPMAFHPSVADLALRHPRAATWLLCSLAEDAEPLGRALARRPRTPDAEVAALVGPEGDWTKAEESALRAAGAVPVALGPAVLRTETAALFALSVLVHTLWEGIDAAGGAD